MANFQYIAKDGSSKTVQAADANAAIKLAADIAPHSGVSAIDAPSVPLAPVPAPASAAPAAPPAPTGQKQPADSSVPPNPSASVPPPAPVPGTTPNAPAGYTVAQGDTLESIAKANGTNIQALMGANPNIENPSALTVGGSINLPQQKQIPVTTSKLSSVSKAVYDAVKKVPDQNDIGAVTAAGAGAIAGLGQVADPVSAAIAPIVAQMGAMIQGILAPGPTYTSLASEYQNLSSQAGLPALQTSMMNLSNIMQGTPDDIRAEITSSGGFATDSQVQAMAAARNTVLLKQYNALQAQYTVAQDYVQNTMQYETADQSERDNQQQLALTKITDASGILDKMTTLQQTILGNATSQYTQIAFGTNGVGLDGLAKIVAGNPYQASLAEMALGLPQGTLSDANKVSQLQAAQNTKALEASAKAYFNANGVYPTWAPNGIPIPGADPNSSDAPSPSAAGSDPATVVGGIDFGNVPGVGAYATDTKSEISGVTRAYNDIQGSDITSYISNNAPNSPVTSDMINSAASTYDIDPNILAATLMNESQFGTLGAGAKTMNPGNVGNTGTKTKQMESWQAGVNATAEQLARRKATAPTDSGVNSQVASYVAAYNAGAITSLSTVPKGIRAQVAAAIGGTGTSDGTGTPAPSYSPLAVNRFTRASNAIIANYIALPQYQLTANGLPYLQRIAAAETVPGSVSDQDLLDSLTKLNTAGNAISDAQVSLITNGQSFADMTSVAENKLKNGGVLSDSQRSQIQQIAKAIYANYQKGYQPVYDQAAKQLRDSGIPEQFWTLPDLNKLNAGQTDTGGGSGSASDKVNTALTKGGYTYAQAVAAVPSGQIGVIDNATGQFGWILPNEYDASAYTKI